MSDYRIIKQLQKSAIEDDYVVFYLYRKISAIFSLFFVKMKISANFVTFLSLLSDFLVIALMFNKFWILAGILVNLAIILDCSDGEVARFYNNKSRIKKKTRYGGFLDETLGTLGFSLLIFFAGYFIGQFWIGFSAMFGLLMIIVTSSVAQNEFPEKRKIAVNFERSIFGKLKGRIGFSNGIQRIFISLTIIFSSPLLLLLFAIAANCFWILKFWVYRKY
jgi:phosphatidylglycerophosphate synthase